ncbi:MAG: DUF177 domain-containing protein [Eubacteriales bacterium]|nr:DUF177 domain-containing protein [Eubacteriales bacterium]
MLLDISKALLNSGERFEFSHEEKIEDQEILGDKVSFQDPITIKGTYELIGEILHLKGRIQARVHAHCVNCLKPIERELNIPFYETYKHLRRGEKPDEELEEFLFFEGKQLDLYPITKTLLLLAIPMRYLCEDSCKGYQKIVDRVNQNTDNACRETPDEAHPFAALKQLLTEDQEV